MKCIWCDLDTTSNKKLVTEKVKYANKEHIFPEAVGGIKCLEVGKVCEDCNKRLGDNIDRFLKTENFMMLKQYQDSSEIIGKPIGKIKKHKRERKIQEMTNLSGYGGGFKIIRDKENTNIIKLTNLPDGTDGDCTYNDKFSLALHKCAVNVLLDRFDYEFMKSNFSELLNFVNNVDNADFLNWSYGVCYANIFSKVHFEPFCLQEIEIETIPRAIVLIFPCAIFIVCTSPNLVDNKLLELVSRNLPKIKNWEKVDFDYFKHFTNGIASSRKSFGEKVKFTLVKKEVAGTQNPDDSFYLLTQCKTCGQTNPTGIMLGKNIVLGKVNGLSSNNKNSWNYHSKEDLKILLPDFKVAESLAKDLETSYGINYPSENDVKKLNISNCKVQCINCFEWIDYDAKDCFL